jgi:pSer/pThr/pTyr-binding forkhead associated (FHA) protein
MVLFRKKAEACEQDRMVQLMIVHGNKDTGDNTGKIFDLQCGNNVMGRDPLCEIRFSSGTVSRRHANLKVSYDKQKFTIFDLGSSNGVIIKPKTIVKNGKKPLVPGDEFQIGEILLKLVIIDQDDGLQTMAVDIKDLLGTQKAVIRDKDDSED